MLCRLERSNLFEDMCGLLSRTAYPAAKGALGALHLVSLDALTAILQAIAAE
jgi:brefeldin A-resistance guanine nucleotide exchange factor 1